MSRPTVFSVLSFAEHPLLLGLCILTVLDAYIDVCRCLGSPSLSHLSFLPNPSVPGGLRASVWTLEMVLGFVPSLIKVVYNCPIRLGCSSILLFWRCLAVKVNIVIVLSRVRFGEIEIGGGRLFYGMA